jgi:hypothetical protein
MKRQFNFWLDSSLAESLKRLAAATERSQSAVVRWLILNESARIGVQPPGGKQEGEEVKLEPVMS